MEVIMPETLLEIFETEKTDSVANVYIGQRQAGFKFELATLDYLKMYLQGCSQLQADDIAATLFDIANACRCAVFKDQAIKYGRLIFRGDPWYYWISDEFVCFRFTQRADGAAIHGFAQNPDRELIKMSLARRQLAEAGDA
jgi:hypothetical protein